MSLTRYLYMTDEVIHSYLDSLLKKRNIKECYFWISEYYYSGFKQKSWSLLWKIFYDFYAIKYPKLEKYMIGQFTLWENNKHISYMKPCILTNIYHFLSGYLI